MFLIQFQTYNDYHTYFHAELSEMNPFDFIQTICEKYHSKDYPKREVKLISFQDVTKEWNERNNKNKANI